jgi:hypothetical protein
VANREEAIIAAFEKWAKQWAVETGRDPFDLSCDHEGYINAETFSAYEGFIGGLKWWPDVERTCSSAAARVFSAPS